MQIIAPKVDSTEYMPWQKWFAWYPVLVNGSRFWGKYVYRRMPIIQWPRLTDVFSEYPPVRSWEYGTIFDVLKGSV